MAKYVTRINLDDGSKRYFIVKAFYPWESSLLLKVQPTTVALATTDVFASPHCSTQNWTGLAELIMHSCKSCPQYFSGSMNLSVKGRLEANASHEYCPTKLAGEQSITTSRHRTFFFNIFPFRYPT